MKRRASISYDDRKVTIARASALEALAAVSDGIAADDALDAAFAQRPGMSAPDKALAMELGYGTLRWRSRLDAEIERHCTKGLPEGPLLDVLRMATYALVFLEVPPHATVSTAVEAARATKGTESAAKFANAVLRALSADAGKIRAQATPPPDAPWKTLAEWYSFPLWMAEAYAAIAGEGLPALLAASNARPPLALRARPGERDALLAALNAGSSPPIARAGRLARDSVVIDAPKGPVSELPGFRQGKFAVQDEGAQLVTELLGDIAGKSVLDVCAAPGGKAIHAAQLGAKVTAVDASAKRLVKLGESARRLGATGIRTVAAEATAAGVAALEGETFDCVLVDAPCSATGIVRRKPDVKWARGPMELARLPPKQLGILEGATKHLKPGGRLVYAVCSLLPAEAERVIDSFLARHPEVSLVAPPAHVAHGRFVRTFPHVHQADGFFVAVMESGG